MRPDSKKKTQAIIQSVIRAMMDRVLENVLVNDPFREEEHHRYRPLYAALVPDEIFKGAHFERRFVTPFGSVWEKVAVAIAREFMGVAEQQRALSGRVRQGRLSRISEVLNRLEHPEKRGGRVKPDWDTELAFVLEGKGDFSQVTVLSDVYVEDVAEHKRFAFELKAPMPNSDQTKVSKEKLLKLYAMEPPLVDGAYYALPYNPYGRKEDYAWAFPARWFNMQEDKVVLIGDEFWDMVGGKGTYQVFVQSIDEIGEEYRDRIRKEYLKIKPRDGGAA